MNFENKTEPKPRYKIGEMIGSLKIADIIGHEYKGLSKRQWWYIVECSCGTTEVLNQSQLFKRTDCKECMNDRRGYAVSMAKTKPGEIPVEIVKALRGKW